MKTKWPFLLTILFLACQTDEADEPEVMTLAPTGIGLNRVVLQATLEETGPLKPVQYGFLLATQAGVNVVSASQQLLIGQASESPLNYSIELNELQPDTEYFVRAFAANGSFTSLYYGDEFSFRTAAPSQYITTLSPTAIGSTSAQLQGEIKGLNELPSVRYGFAWSTLPFTNVLQANVSVIGDSTTPITYQTTLTGLQSGTVYYYRAFLSNEEGTVFVYGEQLSFRTN